MPFPIGSPLELTVSEIFHVRCNAMVDVTLIRPLNKRSFILLPINFSYTTSYRLSIVTFVLGRTVSHKCPQYIMSQTDDDDDRCNTVAQARPLVRSAKNHTMKITYFIAAEFSVPYVVVCKCQLTKPLAWHSYWTRHY